MAKSVGMTSGSVAGAAMVRVTAAGMRLSAGSGAAAVVRAVITIRMDVMMLEDRSGLAAARRAGRDGASSQNARPSGPPLNRVMNFGGHRAWHSLRRITCPGR